MASAAVESFVTKQLDLLELERDAEVEERRCGAVGSSPARPASGRDFPARPEPGPQRWGFRPPLELGRSPPGRPVPFRGS